MACPFQNSTSGNYVTLIFLFQAIFLIVCLAGMSLAMPYPYPYAMPDEGYGHPAPSYEPKIGRVKMQVQRKENIFSLKP